MALSIRHYLRKFFFRRGCRKTILSEPSHQHSGRDYCRLQAPNAFGRQDTLQSRISAAVGTDARNVGKSAEVIARNELMSKRQDEYGISADHFIAVDNPLRRSCQQSLMSQFLLSSIPRI